MRSSGESSARQRSRRPPASPGAPAARVRRHARRAASAGLLVAALVAGCAPGAGQRDLDELDRLAFVPAGQVYVSAFLPIVLYESREALLVERFESTRAQWVEFARREPQALAPEMLARARAWPDEQGAWPATWMTQPEAQRFAAWRGMRLLRPGEWLYCALGQERRRFPWVAYERQDSVANTLELGLGRPCPVGTFEGGRTPRQVYDLLGNAAEWVDGSVLDADEGSDRDPERAVSALGGSFRTWLRPIYRPVRAGDPPERAYLAYELHPRSRQDDVGVRCAVAAAEYLEQAAARWGDAPATRARLVEIGRRWGRAAVPLLSELAARPGAPAGLDALLEGAQG